MIVTRCIALAALLLLAVAAASYASAAEEAGSVPRFASLRADQVNLRAGPGTRYPIEWVYLRRALPVEIVAKFENWRKVRDVDGTIGWVHHSMLSRRRTVIVAGTERTLFSAPDEGARAVLRVEPRVTADLLTCEGAWCRIAVAGHKAWIRRAHIWGVYADEAIE